MGQQQLLLVILVTIIVGIATVVAINIFGTASQQANRDAVRQDLLAAAATAQGIYARPQLMGGIGENFANLADIRRLNIPQGSGGEGFTSTATEIQNANGTYTMTTNADDVLAIQAVPSSGGDNIVMTLSRQDAAGDAVDEWRINWGDGS